MGKQLTDGWHTLVLINSVYCSTSVSNLLGDVDRMLNVSVVVVVIFCLRFVEYMSIL